MIFFAFSADKSARTAFQAGRFEWMSDTKA
jgi:hypothetical protein